MPAAFGAVVLLLGNVVAIGLVVSAAWWVVAALGRLRRLDVSGRWVVVTGCDSGIGLGVVGGLAVRGAKVVACCLTEAGVSAAMSAGASVAPRFDLSDEAAVTAAARELVRTCGGAPWAVVHNAGVVFPGFVDYLPLDLYRRVMEVNFFAPVHLTRLLLPGLRASHGRVVVVSSVDGIVSLPGNAPYDASKFALEAWADALRTEVAAWGVEVSVVNPSTMRTPLAMRFFEAHRTAWDAMHAHEPDGEWQRIYPREWLDAFIPANTARLASIAQDPSTPIADIVHAVTAVRPRLRYLSGTLAKTFFYALWVGPESITARFKRTLINPAPRIVTPARDGVT